MSIRPHRVPAYRLHKPSGQAVVTLDGKDAYLGRHGAPESHEEYARVIAKWLVARKQPPAVPSTQVPLTITEMILAFWKHGEKHYRHADGTPTGELDNFRDALRPLRKLYGRSSACDFGPLMRPSRMPASVASWTGFVEIRPSGARPAKC